MKQLNNGKEAREEIKSGVDAVANHVKSTLGAEGRNVLIQRDGQAPIITKDGVTVARHIVLPPSLKQAGADAVKEAAERTLQKAGDGTTTTCVLAQAIYRRGCSLLDNGSSAYDIRNGIELGTNKVVQMVKDRSKPISIDGNDMYNVALVSANGDEIVANSLNEAYKHSGVDGAIVINRSPNKSTYVELGNGCCFDKGLVDPKFANTSKGTVEFDNPVIYITDRHISKLDEGLVRLCESSMADRRPLVIISPAVTMEALVTLLKNKIHNGLEIACVTAPSFINQQHELLEDIAAYVGGTLDSVVTGNPLFLNDQLQVDILGTAGKIVISDTKTSITMGGVNSEVLEQRIKYVMDNIKDPDELMRSYFKYRLALLTGKSASIFVGGDSDMEVDERIDRVDDALKSVKSALEEGIVEGGGACLYKIGAELKEENKYENIVYESIMEPLKTMLDNAYIDPSSVICEWTDKSLGFNIRTRTFEPLMETGIVDSTKVVRCALENAASVATMLLTTNCTISNN